MSEEGIDDVVERGMRQLLAAAGQVAERVARLRQELLRRNQQSGYRENHEQLRTMATDRASMRAVLAPVNRFEWWSEASAEAVASAYQAAEAWKDYDPAALQASQRIREEVKARYGINTDDLQGDHSYLKDALGTQQKAAATAEELRKHNDAMALIATAQAAEMNREAQGLRGEIERLQVPEQYLADPDLLTALKQARDASDDAARSNAEGVVAERLHLINEDGLQGPTIEQLREEIGSNYSRADDSLFADAAFVAAAKDWHDARVLAEGGFANRDERLQGRYEAAEKELFSRIDGLGRDIENKVLNDPRTSSAGRDAHLDTRPAYDSAERRAQLGRKLDGTASPEDIRGRLVAAADQGAHPREATRQSTKGSNGPRQRPAATPSRERVKGGQNR